MINPAFFIIRNISRPNLEVCSQIAKAVYGSSELNEFTEKYVPKHGRVPEPKVQNFASFLNNGVKELWGIIDSENLDPVSYIGFIVLADNPHRNSIGFGINKHFSRKNKAKYALSFALFEMQSKYIGQTIYAHTSKDNLPAQTLLASVGFKYAGEEIDFMGAHFKYEYSF